MNKKVEVILPIPPSVNTLFAGKQRRFPSGKYKEWKKKALEEFNLQAEINPEQWLQVRYTYYMPLYFKNGNVKKRDVANYEKALSDFLGDNIKGFDDMMIVDMRLKKIDSDRNEVECVIQEINE